MEPIWRLVSGLWQDGGAEGVRTPDLLNAIQALYQLSYDPIRSGENVRSGRICQNAIAGLLHFEVLRTGL